MTDHGSALDVDLVDRARQGDQQAMVELWSRHYPAVLAAARRAARQPRDAEEMASDAFAGMLAALSSGGGPTGSVRAYLLTSVKNVAVTRARRASATDVLIDDMTAFESNGAARDPVARISELGLIREAFSALPHRWQTVLWRTAVDRESNITVGRELDLSPNAVAALARRARRGLRTAYVQAHVSQHGIAPACEPYVSRLADLAVSGNTTPADVTAHVDGCERCTDRVAELRAVDSNMAGLLGPAILTLLPTASAGTASALAAAPGGVATGAATGTRAARRATRASGGGGTSGAATVLGVVTAHGPLVFGVASLVAGTLATAGLVGVTLWPHSDASASGHTRAAPAQAKAPTVAPTPPRQEVPPDAGAAPAGPTDASLGEPDAGAKPGPAQSAAPRGPAAGLEAGGRALPAPGATATPSPPAPATTPAPTSAPSGTSPSAPSLIVTATMSGRPVAVTTVTARGDGTTGPLTLTVTVPDGVVLAGSSGDWHVCSQAGRTITCQAEHSSTGHWTGTVTTDWAGQAAGRVQVTVTGQGAGGSSPSGSVAIPWSSSTPLVLPSRVDEPVQGDQPLR
jgi:RNA polymerase sigma factor (sigma-70 family)